MMSLADGQTFAGYTIVGVLGVGGMGEVYLAQHPRLPRQDALKVLGTGVSHDDEFRQRFNQEAEMVAGLRHRNIVTIYDRGDCDGRLWIAMEYVDGTDAGRLLLERYPRGIPPAEVVRIVTAVAEALDYAHSCGLLHRDIKPANILLGTPGHGDPRVLLADFGVARWLGQTSDLTGTDMTVGTVTYAAPEQLKGEAVDGQADQYALAATAYHLMTGSAPFVSTNPTVVISQHLSAPPPAVMAGHPELIRFAPVFGRALAKDPKDRFKKCGDFAAALKQALEGGCKAPAALGSRGIGGSDAGRRRSRGGGAAVPAAQGSTSAEAPRTPSCGVGADGSARGGRRCRLLGARRRCGRRDRCPRLLRPRRQRCAGVGVTAGPAAHRS